MRNFEQIAIVLSLFLCLFLKPTLASGLMDQLALYTGENINEHFVGTNSVHTLEVADIDEDGYDDVITGARYHTPGGGVYVFKGKSTLTDTNASNADIILRDMLESDTALGETVSTGDIDGDGHLELLVGNYRYPHPEDNAGAVYIFKTGPNFSSRDASEAEALVNGTYYRNSFGPPTVAIGDINGDNYEDYISNPLVEDKCYLFYGGPSLTNKTSLEADITYSDCIYSFFSKSADINGDGYNDIILSSLANKSVSVIFGGKSLSNKSIYDADISIVNPAGQLFGVKGIAAVDINMDGFIDIIAKSSMNVYIFYGSSNWQDKTTADADVTIAYDPSSTSLSGSLAVNDINNDGYPDIITADTSINEAYVFYGGKNLTSKDASQADLVAIGPSGYNFGTSFGSGDLNADGYNDIVVGDSSYADLLGGIFIFSPRQGSPSISFSSPSYTTDNTSANISGTITDNEGKNIGNVQWSFANEVTGNWGNCEPQDGSFNSSTEKFSCNIDTYNLDPGEYAIYVRSSDQNGVYMPNRDYSRTNLNVISASNASYTIEALPAEDITINNEEFQTPITAGNDLPTTSAESKGNSFFRKFLTFTIIGAAGLTTIFILRKFILLAKAKSIKNF